MNNELYFSGKKFISAKRASEISGYTADYIGQLCRLKKLENRRIGKAWFVAENSLLEHIKNSTLKPSERPVPTPTLKSSTQILPSSYFSPPPILGLKPEQEIFYVSAKRASEITGYTQDYIGQLCRSNNLDCKQVGKRWFISEVSLREHKENTAKKERGVIYFPPTVLPKIETPPESVLLKIEAPLAPQKPKTDEILKTKTLFKKPAFLISTISFAVIAVLFFSISSNKNLSSRVALVYQNTFQTAQTTQTTQTNNSASLGGALKDSLGTFFNHLASGTYRFVSSLFNFETADKVATLDSEQVNSVYKNDTQMGITVLPSSGDEIKDEKTKQQIKDSFSDQTEVFPDKTGSSGVIKPVFTKLSDQNYLYVMVPITERKTK